MNYSGRDKEFTVNQQESQELSSKIISHSLLNLQHHLILLVQSELAGRSHVLVSWVSFLHAGKYFADYDEATRIQSKEGFAPFVCFIMKRIDDFYCNPDMPQDLNEVSYLSPQMVFHMHHKTRRFETIDKALNFTARLSRQQPEGYEHYR